MSVNVTVRKVSCRRLDLCRVSAVKTRVQIVTLVLVVVILEIYAFPRLHRHRSLHMEVMAKLEHARHLHASATAQVGTHLLVRSLASSVQIRVSLEILVSAPPTRTIDAFL